jgi:hypothetical protein
MASLQSCNLQYRGHVGLSPRYLAKLHLLEVLLSLHYKLVCIGP